MAVGSGGRAARPSDRERRGRQRGYNGSAGGKEQDPPRGSRRGGRRKRSPWRDLIDELFELCCDSATENTDLLLEVLGTMGNLTPNDLPDSLTFADLIARYNLVEFFQRQLVPGMAQDDIILQIIILVGAMVAEHEAARVLIGSPIIKTVYDVMRSKRDDDEIVLQTLYAFMPLLTHPDTYESLVYETNFVDEVCRSLSKRNNEVQVVCEQILKIVMELDRVEAKPPKKKKQRGRDDEMEEDSEDEDSFGYGSKEVDLDTSADFTASGHRKGQMVDRIKRQRYLSHNNKWISWARSRTPMSVMRILKMRTIAWTSANLRRTVAATWTIQGRMIWTTLSNGPWASATRT